jgi:hypothetical protein
MIERSDAVHDAPCGYRAHAVLDAAMCESIRETNLAFLALVAASAAAQPGTGAFGLPPEVAAGVGTLDARARRAVAGCPYTLFNLRFEDAPFWDGVAQAAHLPGSASLSDEATFARTAVFLAWHLAHHAALGAALVLGMTDAVQAAWRRLPLSAIDRAATVALPHLAARFPGHPRFWPRLVAVDEPEGRAAEAVRQLGLQLLAAEGIVACAPVAPGLR